MSKEEERFLKVYKHVKASVDAIRYMFNNEEEKECAYQIGRLHQFIESTILELSLDEYKEKECCHPLKEGNRPGG